MNLNLLLKKFLIKQADIWSKKIAAVLKNKGYKISERLVSELMFEMNLISICTDSKKIYQKLNKPPRKRNVLQQHFNTSAPNQVWVSDVTFFTFNKIFNLCNS